MSDNVKLFVGNLPLDATHEEINKLFEPYGEIGTCSLLRQYAFITLKGEGAADRAIRYLDGKEYRGRPLVVEESRARPPNSTKVFVGNLSATCTADDLHGLFQTFGRVLDCDKVKARLCSNAGYAFVHMERKEDAVQAIEGLNGTVFKGRQLSVELSKAQPLNNLIAAGMAPHEGLAMGGGPREGLLPRPPPSLEHHQSQAAVLAAAAAAAAGLPIQVQQSVHNSFYNTTAFDPTYAALKGLTAAKGPNPAIYGALASQVYGSVADQLYQDSTGHQEATATPETDHQGGSNPTALFEAARAKFFQQGQKVLAEQQAGRKVGSAGGGGASDRDRSPIRGGRGPLLPDPVPGSAPQIRGKRRALLPTPPGGPEDPAAAPTATETPAASEATDPIARCYAEYYQQMQQYQNYQQYQQQYQYLQYAYTNPPPPPPPPPPSASVPPPSSSNNNHHHNANNNTAPAPPGTYGTDSSTTYAPPVSYASSGGGGAGSGGYPSSGGYDVAAAARGYSAASAASYEQQQQQSSSGAYGNSYDAPGNYDGTAAGNYDAAATGNYDASSYASAYGASTGGGYAAGSHYSAAASRAYEQQTPTTTTAHGQSSLPQQRHQYPYHHTPEPPYR